MLYPEDNTDDEQEDLPYDGDLQNIHQHNCDSRNLENSTCVEDGSQHVFTLTPSHMSCHSKAKSNCKTQLPETKINLAVLQRGNDMAAPKATEKELLPWDVNSLGRNQHPSNSNISDVLLRHFPQEELSSLCQLIDSETIPEISFTESFDETILNKIKISESTRVSLPKEEGKNIECCNSEREVKFELVDKNWDLTEVKEFVLDQSMNPICDRKDCKEDNLQFVNEKEHAINEDFHYFSTPKEVYQEHKYFLETTSHDLKSGQRQVHYRLPDFSKVAPKVKIPKEKNSNSCPIPKKNTPPPNLLGKSEAVKDVLEAVNFQDSVATMNEEKRISTPELDQQLKMLTKQAEAQNHIDNLRFTKILPCSNQNRPNPGMCEESHGITTEMSTALPVTVSVKPMVGFSQSPFSELQSQRMILPLSSADTARQSSGNQLVLQNVTEEENLSQMLKEQSEELKVKVETFSNCLTQGVFPAEERHQLLRLLKEQLDKLEWNYLTTKEKHCTFRHQHRKYSSMSIGEFDPNRKVEGEIFKLGMLLEDIKEKIDKTCSPHSSAFVTSPSITPCESASPYSSCSESPVISTITESPQKTASAMTIATNKKYGENRSQPREIILQRMCQQSNKGSQHHPFHQDQLELHTKQSCEDIANSLEKLELPANNQSTNHSSFSPIKKTGGLQSHKPLIGRENQNDYSDQENTDGYWETRSPPPSNPYNASNQDSNAILKEQGSLIHSSDHRFLDELRNSAKDHIIIHPRLKIQLSSRQVCPCSSKRNKKVPYRKTKEKPDCESYSIFLEGKAVDLDISGCDTEDTSFSHLLDSSSSEVCLENSIKNHGSWTMGLQEKNEASSQKQSLNLQRIHTKKQPEQFMERQNLHIPQTRCSRMHDTVILSPQYLTSRNIHRRSLCSLRNRHIKETHSKILSSTLDDVIQTANNLKKTTEHMVQVVSEDLAKAKIQTLSSLEASKCQYYI